MPSRRAAMAAIAGCSINRKVIGPPGLAVMFRQRRSSSSAEMPYQAMPATTSPNSNVTATRANSDGESVIPTRSASRNSEPDDRLQYIKRGLGCVYEDTLRTCFPANSSHLREDRRRLTSAFRWHVWLASATAERRALA